MSGCLLSPVQSVKYLGYSGEKNILDYSTICAWNKVTAHNASIIQTLLRIATFPWTLFLKLNSNPFFPIRNKSEMLSLECFFMSSFRSQPPNEHLPFPLVKYVRAGAQLRTPLTILICLRHKAATALLVIASAWMVVVTASLLVQISCFLQCDQLFSLLSVLPGLWTPGRLMVDFSIGSPYPRHYSRLKSKASLGVGSAGVVVVGCFESPLYILISIAFF